MIFLLNSFSSPIWPKRLLECLIIVLLITSKQISYVRFKITYGVLDPCYITCHVVLYMAGCFFVISFSLDCVICSSVSLENFLALFRLDKLFISQIIAILFIRSLAELSFFHDLPGF